MYRPKFSLNSIIPAAPSGTQNVEWQCDDTTDPPSISANVPISIGTKLWPVPGDPNGTATNFAPSNMTGPSAPSPYAVTSSGDSGEGDSAVWHPFDGVPLTNSWGWASNVPPGPNWIEIDLGSTSLQLARYAIMAGSNPADVHWAAPKEWTLSGSNDGTAWTTLDTQTGQVSWSAHEVRLFFLPTTASIGYRYYKLNITDYANVGFGGYINVQQIYLYTVSGVWPYGADGDFAVDISGGKGFYGPRDHTATPIWPLIFHGT